jgi:hypothetical protein
MPKRVGGLVGPAEVALSLLRNGLPQGAGEMGPLKRKSNFFNPPHLSPDSRPLLSEIIIFWHY